MPTRISLFVITKKILETIETIVTIVTIETIVAMETKKP